MADLFNFVCERLPELLLFRSDDAIPQVGGYDTMRGCAAAEPDLDEILQSLSIDTSGLLT